MENTTHLFLATRFNCNKCHDHPFERWTQDQYYHLAGVLRPSAIARRTRPAATRSSAARPSKAASRCTKSSPTRRKARSRTIRTGAVSPPAFPFECKHEAKEGEPRREELADWITSPDNPYFAKSYVNRLWGYLTGRGIIEPLDDIRAGNPPTNPELLDYLTGEFIKSGFDTRHVMQLICKSRTYQLVGRDQQVERRRPDQLLARPRPPACRPKCCTTRSIARPARRRRSPASRPAPARPRCPMSASNCRMASSATSAARPAKAPANASARSNLQLGPVMALVSGPTVGNAISDPENAIAKLVSRRQGQQRSGRRASSCASSIGPASRTKSPRPPTCSRNWSRARQARRRLRSLRKGARPETRRSGRSSARTASPACKPSSKPIAKSPSSAARAPRKSGTSASPRPRPRSPNTTSSSRRSCRMGSRPKEARRAGTRSNRSKWAQRIRAKLARAGRWLDLRRRRKGQGRVSHRRADSAR